jgi:hypothetical protein
MAVCPLSLITVVPVTTSVGVSDESAYVCSPVAAWPLEVDMRRELAPFEHSCIICACPVSPTAIPPMRAVHPLQLVNRSMMYQLEVEVETGYETGIAFI